MSPPPPWARRAVQATAAAPKTGAAAAVAAPALAVHASTPPPTPSRRAAQAVGTGGWGRDGQGDQGRLGASRAGGWQLQACCAYFCVPALHALFFAVAYDIRQACPHSHHQRCSSWWSTNCTRASSALPGHAMPPPLLSREPCRGRPGRAGHQALRGGRRRRPGAPRRTVHCLRAHGHRAPTCSLPAATCCLCPLPPVVVPLTLPKASLGLGLES